MMELFDYARSSAAFRVRIALNLKGLAYRQTSVDLLAGAQRDAGYRRLNPQGLVPALVDGALSLTQSMAILEYLEEVYPSPALLPKAPGDRARVRALAHAVACDIHPLNNLRVLQYLVKDLGHDEDAKLRWYRHWIAEGLSSLEAMVEGGAGRLCHGDSPSLADVCLVPQIFNAQRYDCPLDAYPRLMAVFAACMALAAFQQAQPSRQADFG